MKTLVVQGKRYLVLPLAPVIATAAATAACVLFLYFMLWHEQIVRCRYPNGSIAEAKISGLKANKVVVDNGATTILMSDGRRFVTGGVCE